MKVQITDLFDNKHVDLTATFSTEHSSSSYGQAVMLIEEWDQPMSHENWVLGGGVVLEATDEEMSDFVKWHSLIGTMVA